MQSVISSGMAQPPVTMSQEEQQDAFERELLFVVERFMGEFSLTIASVLGVLEKIKLEVHLQQVMDPVVEYDEDEDSPE